MARKTLALQASNTAFTLQLELPFTADSKVKQIGLTQARLRELLDYDPETGTFTWRVNRGPMKPGNVAGSVDTWGHRQIKIDGRMHLEHRLAWLYVHGYWPACEVDHRDMIRSNNRLSNLRLATHAENMRNTGARKNNAAGVKGVFRKGGRWRAQITVDGRRFLLGSFGTADAAGAAYIEAAAKYHGEFARAA